MRGLDWFCVAGVWRAHPEAGEAFALLTTEPGPDVAPYHSRQVVVLTPADYAAGSTPPCRPASCAGR